MSKNKIKTLKEVENKYPNVTIRKMMAMELRSEAIKEIKQYKEMIKSCFAGMKKEEIFSTEGFNEIKTSIELIETLLDRVNYIMWKNNLTKEDLK